MAPASHVQQEEYVGRQQSVNLLDEDVGHARLELTLVSSKGAARNSLLAQLLLPIIVLLAVRHAPVDFHLLADRCCGTADL